MLVATSTAVIGGMILGLLAALVGRRTNNSWLFAMTGAVAGALGLLLYAISSNASNEAVASWWQGLSWVVVCVLFAITGAYIASSDHR